MSNQTCEYPFGTSEKHVFRYVAEDGHTLEFTPHQSQRFDVVPLGFKQLIQAVGNAPAAFQFTLTNASVPRTLTGLDVDGPLTVTAELTLQNPVLAFGLVDGGWLPLPFAHKQIALLDRNVIIALEKLLSSRSVPLATAPLANLTSFLGLDTQTLSPMLFALEGARRRPPTDFQMRTELSRAAATLRSFFPGSKIEPITTRKRKALLRMVLDHTEFRSRATRLLVQAAPLVAERVKPGNRQKLELEVLRIARAEGVRVECITVLALISCIYDAPGAFSTHRAATPGRAVLKPKREYTEEDAYNALADMFFLEIMLHTFELFPHAQPVLYTRDLGITALWTAIQPTLRRMTKVGLRRSETTVTFPLTNGLFPSLSHAELQELKGRLKL